MIAIKSNWLKKDIEVGGYNVTANGQDVVLMNHADFEALYLEFEEEFQLSREYIDLTDLYKYPAIRCIIRSGLSDIHHTGNKIGSAHPKSLKNAVSQQFPAEMAEKRAFDRAVKEFFALESRVYSEEEILESKIVRYNEDAAVQPDVVTESSADAIAQEKVAVEAIVPAEEVAKEDAVQEVPKDANDEVVIDADTVVAENQDTATIEAPVIPDEDDDCANVNVTFGQYWQSGQKLTVKETFEYDQQMVSQGLQKKSLIDFFLTKARPDPERNPERAKQLEAIKKYAASIGYVPGV